MDYLKNESEPEELQPEVKLWRAVLSKAFEDALYRGLERPLIVHKNEAHMWFVKNNDDFAYVCYCSLFEPEYIHDKYFEMLESGKIRFTKKQIKYLKWRKIYDQRRNKNK